MRELPDDERLLIMWELAEDFAHETGEPAHAPFARMLHRYLTNHQFAWEIDEIDSPPSQKRGGK